MKHHLIVPGKTPDGAKFHGVQCSGVTDIPQHGNLPFFSMAICKIPIFAFSWNNSTPHSETNY
jgi:hypothetical protein